MTFADFKIHTVQVWPKRILVPEIYRLILNMYLQTSHAMFSGTSFLVTMLRARALILQFVAGLKEHTENV